MPGDDAVSGNGERGGEPAAAAGGDAVVRYRHRVRGAPPGEGRRPVFRPSRRPRLAGRRPAGRPRPAGRGRPAAGEAEVAERGDEAGIEVLPRRVHLPRSRRSGGVRPHGGDQAVFEDDDGAVEDGSVAEMHRAAGDGVGPGAPVGDRARGELGGGCRADCRADGGEDEGQARGESDRGAAAGAVSGHPASLPKPGGGVNRETPRAGSPARRPAPGTPPHRAP